MSSLLNFGKEHKMNTNNKQVDGKDLVPGNGQEYFYIDKGNKEFLGNFVGKISEFFDDGPHGYGTEVYYVFEYGVNKKKIRYYHGEEIIFYECI
jgi:hypothetical protein